MSSTTGAPDRTTPSGAMTLVVAEVAGIQDWIVGNATELRIIRGGSLLLAEAFAAAEQRLLDEFGPAASITDQTADGARWQLVARASGRLVAIVPSTESDRIARELRALLAERLQGLAVTVGLGPMDTPPQAGETPFDAARRAAREHLLPASTRQPVRYHLGTATCDASGVETASRVPTAEGWRLSPNSDRRQRADLADLDVPGVVLERRMSRIGAATRSARFRRYVAVVCADGNAIGARFRDLHTAAEVARASADIARGVEEVEEAAYRAAVDLHEQLGGTAPLPVNPLMRAGDDLRYVVPAHVALAFAHALTSSALLPACAGVFFCHDTLPFSQSHAAAEELLATAKRASKAEGDGTAPFVGFALQSGSGVGTLNEHDRRTASPYRSQELPALQAAARSLDASSSQLRRTSDAIGRGGRVAEREWALQWLSASAEQRRLLADLWEALGSSGPVEERPFPVRRWLDADVETSPIGDLLLLRQLMTSGDDTEVRA